MNRLPSPLRDLLEALEDFVFYIIAITAVMVIFYPLWRVFT